MVLYATSGQVKRWRALAKAAGVALSTWLAMGADDASTEVDGYRSAIERTLGRRLYGAELARATSLADLAPATCATALALARRNLVLCAHYLRWLAPPVGVGEAKRFIDDLLTANPEETKA